MDAAFDPEQEGSEPDTTPGPSATPEPEPDGDRPWEWESPDFGVNPDGGDSL